MLEIIPSLRLALFSPAEVRLGLKRPDLALEKNGIRIFSLENYDPTKRPVLLIHGISDSPRSFSAIARGLSESGMQPWMLYYPSGLALSLVASRLRELLEDIWRSTRFFELAIVAHSMGGLLARAFLIERSSEAQPNYRIPSFLSLSSPWGGTLSANIGTKISPIVKPLWREIASACEFIKALSTFELPPETSWHLIYSRGTRPSLFGSFLKRDGFVSVATQTPAWALSQAKTVDSFAVTHSGILTSAQARTLIVKRLVDPGDN